MSHGRWTETIEGVEFKMSTYETDFGRVMYGDTDDPRVPGGVLVENCGNEEHAKGEFVEALRAVLTRGAAGG